MIVILCLNPKHWTNMSQTISDNQISQSPFEVVVPSRGMRGWAIVPWTEDSEPKTPEQNILPHGQKRIRSQTKRFGNEVEYGHTAKRKTTPSLEDKQEKIQPARIRVGVRVRSKEHNQLEREIQRLKMQNDLLAVAESREIQILKADVKRLQGLKVEQNKKIDRLIAKTANSASSSSFHAALDESEIIKIKDKEIEQQNATIKDLQYSLRSALKLDTLLSNSQQEELLTANVNFAHEMKDIELRVLRTAEFLSNCLYPLDKLPFTIQIHPDLGDMIRKVIGSVNTLSSMPGLSLRALLFHIIRDQIMHSDMWTALHMEGYMLRAYQQAIQQCGMAQSISQGSATLLIF
jgi:hypothetical protein